MSQESPIAHQGPEFRAPEPTKMQTMYMRLAGAALGQGYNAPAEQVMTELITQVGGFGQKPKLLADSLTGYPPTKPEYTHPDAKREPSRNTLDGTRDMKFRTESTFTQATGTNLSGAVSATVKKERQAPHPLTIRERAARVLVNRATKGGVNAHMYTSK